MNKNLLNKIPGGVGLIADLLPEKEKFEEDLKNDENIGKYYVHLIIKLANFLISLYAFYLAFKCGGKFYPDLLAACCCSPFYIVYRLAKKC